MRAGVVSVVRDGVSNGGVQPGKTIRELRADLRSRVACTSGVSRERRACGRRNNGGARFGRSVSRSTSHHLPVVQSIAIERTRSTLRANASSRHARGVSRTRAREILRGEIRSRSGRRASAPPRVRVVTTTRTGEITRAQRWFSRVGASRDIRFKTKRREEEEEGKKKKRGNAR